MFKIASSSNQFIKDIKKLKRKKNRWDEKKYLIEGKKLIEEAINYKRKINYIIVSEKFRELEENERLIEDIGKSLTIIEVTNSIFTEISDTETPQGIMAVVSFTSRDLEDLFRRENNSIIFLDALQDPGNLGTIIRTADAFKIDAIIIGEGTVDPYNEKVVRATMGSIFRVPIFICKDNSNFFKLSSSAGYKIVSTDLNGQAIYEESFNEGHVFVIGNESQGVSKDILKLSDKKIKIPMPGGAESLNAGVAASIIMYEAMKYRDR